MLSSHVRDGEARKQQLAKELAAGIARGRALAGELSAKAEREANAAVAEAYELEKAIAREIKLLSLETAEAARRAKRFEGSARELSTALKQLGDLENWTASLEAAAKEIVQVAQEKAVVASAGHSGQTADDLRDSGP